MKNIQIILVLAIVCSPFQQLMAWGKIGHRVIAQVAYDNLNCKARRNVDKLLGKQGIVYYANWADEIKSDTIYRNSYDWHYQDFNPGMTDSEVVATLSNYPAEGGNLFRAMDSLIDELHRNRRNVDALCFVIHLMGDRFCPMHTAHLDDLGGNKVYVEWFKQPSNMHSVWDDGLIKYREYSYSEYAAMLENTLGGQAKQIRQMSQEEILLHNYELCNQIYEYHATWDKNCYKYAYHFTAQLDWQLYAAGIRLAMLLNEIYG